MLQWIPEPAPLGQPPSTLGQSDSGYNATYTLLGWVLFGLAVYGAVVLIRKV